MLLDHEAKLERSKKSTLYEPMSVNVAQTASAPPHVVSHVQTDPFQLMSPKACLNLLLCLVLLIIVADSVVVDHLVAIKVVDLVVGSKCNVKFVSKGGRLGGRSSICYHWHSSMMPP